MQDAFAILEAGNSLFQQNRLAEAERCYRQAIEWHPKYPQAYTNLGSVLQEKGLLSEAIAHHQHAVCLNPDWVDALYNLGNAAKEFGDNELAIQSFERAIALRPDFAQAHLNLGLTLLLMGRLREGWRNYEWRFACGQPSPRSFQQPRWDGTAAPSKTLLVYAEQGFGDILMFSRYLPLVKRLSHMQLVFECPIAMRSILQSIDEVDQFVSPGEALPQFDFQVPLLSLPYVCQTEFQSIPSGASSLSSSYLSPNHELVEKWKPRFASKKKLKVGIAWQGDPTYRWDHLRSVPLKLFEPLGNLPNIELVSLQKGRGSEQLSDVVSSFPIEDLGETLDVANGAFTDTAAIMTHLDLVISPDTAIVHLAGALGVPTWLMLPTVPHWVWWLDRTDSPWYPSTRLFRQTAAGKWGPVIESITEALSDSIANHAPMVRGRR